MEDWVIPAVIIFSGLIAGFLSGLPVAFCFLLLNLIAVWVYWGGAIGLVQIGHSLWSSVDSFIFLPAPLFILMGEVLFRSGVASRAIDALDTWLGRMPGRLGLLSVVSGTLFATMSGSAMAGTAMLGSVLVPEVRKRGYAKSMAIGPILAAGALAIVIPPSTTGVILACLAYISVGKLLVAIIVPGLILSSLYFLYIIIRCHLQPSLAPSYEAPSVALTKKVMLLFRDVVPLGLIIFLTLGTIYMGIATPSEAAALGTVSAFFMAVIYSRDRKNWWKWSKDAVYESIRVAGMVLIIIMAAFTFSRLLAESGVTRGVTELAINMTVSPIIIVISMQFILLIMGMFMEQAAIMMVTIPIFMPVILSLGLNELWFATMFLLNMEIGVISPPFGHSLFVMRGVTPPDVSMGDIYAAAYPFVLINLLVMGLLLTFPVLALWLPGMMG